MEAWAREVVDLHREFAALFRGDHDDLARLEAALAPEFRMIGPDGIVRDRAATIEAVAGLVGRRPVDIEIHDPRLVAAGPPLVGTYEEWHREPGGPWTGRVTTAVFDPCPVGPGTPHGYRWLLVHETWLALD
ncbi:MAG TPA: DUF4440 domain-containing protein [Actinobacteria bacterium]|nr:DUF4440 domain-containing protein [Actinomycetota bacterium]